MGRKLFFLLLIVVVFLMGGCTKKPEVIEKFYLAKEYYDKGGFISIDENDLDKLDSSNYVIFTYNNYCNLSIPCEQIFEEFMNQNQIRFLSIPFENYRNTSLYNTVKYAPSVIIVNRGKIVAYLDANSDDDLDKYQSVKSFSKWISTYVYFNSK